MNRRYFQSLSLLFVIFCGNFIGQTIDDRITIGEKITLTSNILFEERNLFVYLPESYNTTQNSYPVLYLLDAEDHFKYTAGFVQFLSRNNKMPETIIIGIPNTFRNRDFLPEKVFNIPGSGGADNFIGFLKEELIPYVDKKYRTQPHRILVGHSLCGMFCFYSMLKQPELFNALIAISPWVIAADNFLLPYTTSSLSKYKSLNKSVYFTAGSKEEENLLTTLEEYKIILRKFAPDDLIWEYKIMEDEDHGSQVFMAIYDGLKMIYKDWNLSDTELKKGLDVILKHYSNLTSKYGYAILPPENILNAVGYYFLGQQNFNEAIAIFAKNVSLYPQSANVYDSLGETYEKSGQQLLANQNYEKAYLIAKEINHPNLQIFKQNFERTQKK
ncbi:MAG: alpha/beta hydrolase-fold protein [Ignavibacteriaceae bacterium]|jgi:hypothetical protein